MYVVSLTFRIPVGAHGVQIWRYDTSNTTPVLIANETTAGTLADSTAKIGVETTYLAAPFVMQGTLAIVSPLNLAASTTITRPLEAASIAPATLVATSAATLNSLANGYTSGTGILGSGGGIRQFFRSPFFPGVR